jgi:hypothetical protein
LRARRYEAVILGVFAETALAEGRRAEALSPAVPGTAGVRGDESQIRRADAFRLARLLEQSREAREAALSTGESLLMKGAVGHNHIWFRRYAIEQALLVEDWGAAKRHADALLARTADEPLLHATLFATRARLLARVGSGTASRDDECELAELRAQSADLGLRIDALGEPLRRT